MRGPVGSSSLETVPDRAPAPGPLERCSVLFPDGRQPDEPVHAPAFFRDLNLDQIVDTVIAGKEAYRLAPFFYLPLENAEEVRWRQEVVRDLAIPGVFASIQAFAEQMQTMRAFLARAERLHHAPQKQRWLLDAARAYCTGVRGLAQALAGAPLASRGLAGFRAFLACYAASERFTRLCQQAECLADRLSAIRYEILIDGLRVEVRRYAGGTDFSTAVEATFEKFRHGASADYAFSFRDGADANHVEEKILDGVVQLFPDAFAELAAFCTVNAAFQAPTIARFEREVQFYVAFLEQVARLRKAGLSFCLPHVAAATKAVAVEQGFDLALAFKLVAEDQPVVCNDFFLEGEERILVVSGPNQGGKTTFARMFGQLHYLARLGLPVPGVRAQCALCDQLFTHFEREEDPRNPRGKLEDDLVRIREILDRATPQSIVIVNEIFASTTWQDALLLSKRIAAKLVERDVLCVWVTFLDELARMGAPMVSMVSTVLPDNPAERTYKIVRAPANGLAYVMSIAERYGLSAAALRRRLEGGA